MNYMRGLFRNEQYMSSVLSHNWLESEHNVTVGKQWAVLAWHQWLVSVHFWDPAAHLSRVLLQEQCVLGRTPRPGHAAVVDFSIHRLAEPKLLSGMPAHTYPWLGLSTLLAAMTVAPWGTAGFNRGEIEIIPMMRWFQMQYRGFMHSLI